MQSTLKLALRLMLFALISGLALALTNALTKEPIRQQEELIANEARAAVFPDADEFVKLEAEIPETYADVDEVYIAMREGETVGYAISLSPYGYKGDIVMTLGVRADGTISELYVNSQSETAGLGSRVAGEPFLSQFEGISASPDAVSSGVDAITGATVSSKAVVSAVQRAVTYAEDELLTAVK